MCRSCSTPRRCCPRRPKVRWSKRPSPPSTTRFDSPRRPRSRRLARPPFRCTSRISAVAEITLIEALRQAMDEELARDERVFLVGEDVGPRGGVFRAPPGLFESSAREGTLLPPLAELSIV